MKSILINQENGINTANEYDLSKNQNIYKVLFLVFYYV